MNRRGRFIHGEFSCNAWPNVQFFDKRMEQVLLPNEGVITKNGQTFAHSHTPVVVAAADFTVHARMRARHETLNGRYGFFKNFETNTLS